MIQTDKKIEFKIKGLNLKYNKLSTSIFLNRFAEILTCILTLFTSIIVLKYFNNKDNLTVGILLFLFMWILYFHYEFLLSEAINLKKDEQIRIKDNIENIKSFSTYLLAYRHLEALKNGNNPYPELRENDSKYVFEQYKDVFEEARIKYEKTNIIDL